MKKRALNPVGIQYDRILLGMTQQQMTVLYNVDRTTLAQAEHKLRTSFRNKSNSYFVSDIVRAIKAASDNLVPSDEIHKASRMIGLNSRISWLMEEIPKKKEQLEVMKREWALAHKVNATMETLIQQTDDQDKREKFKYVTYIQASRLKKYDPTRQWKLECLIVAYTGELESLKKFREEFQAA